MDDQLCYIRNMETDADTWKALDYHENNMLSNKMYLMRMIYSLKFEEGGEAIAHLLWFRKGDRRV